jgi:hypothetical protein
MKINKLCNICEVEASELAATTLQLPKFGNIRKIEFRSIAEAVISRR